LQGVRYVSFPLGYGKEREKRLVPDLKENPKLLWEATGPLPLPSRPLVCFWQVAGGREPNLDKLLSSHMKLAKKTHAAKTLAAAGSEHANGKQLHNEAQVPDDDRAAPPLAQPSFAHRPWSPTTLAGARRPEPHRHAPCDDMVGQRAECPLDRIVRRRFARARSGRARRGAPIVLRQRLRPLLSRQPRSRRGEHARALALPSLTRAIDHSVEQPRRLTVLGSVSGVRIMGRSLRAAALLTFACSISVRSRFEQRRRPNG
jgi:hypothetical protein